MTDSVEPYLIEWSSPARRTLAGLPDKVAAVIIEFVYGPLADHPPRVGRPLRWEFDGLHSARRGDFRVVYHIDAERRVVVIEAIGHRSDLYRRR